MSDNNFSTLIIMPNTDLEMPNNTGTGTLPTPKTAKPKKQLKKQKDPEAPRRPLSPYMIFVKERTKIVADMGSMVAIGEVGKEIGRIWGLMDQQEKMEYEDTYKQDKARCD